MTATLLPKMWKSSLLPENMSLIYSCSLILSKKTNYGRKRRRNCPLIRMKNLLLYGPGSLPVSFLPFFWQGSSTPEKNTALYASLEEESSRKTKKHDGRINQKELRKEMLYLSEAKVSLIVTELEHKGMIEKIKKGRGNVLILKV